MEQLLEASKSCGSDQVCYLLTYICMGSGYVIYLSISIYGPGKLLIPGQGQGELFSYRCPVTRYNTYYLYLGKNQIITYT